MTRNKFLAMLGVVAAAVAIDAMLGSGFAQATGSSTVFSNLQNKATDLFYQARMIILIVCAIAIIGTMATAISGRFPVGKALAIVGAIVVIGLSSEIVTYFASGTSSSSSAAGSQLPSLTDTGTSNAP